jgi:hypothetical protein
MNAAKLRVTATTTVGKKTVIDAVLLFGAMNMLMEFVLLGMIPPRWRLRVLGSPAGRNSLHILFLVANLVIHWGTVIGTMSAVMAFVASIVTVRIAMLLYGYVIDDRHYHVGWVKYSVEELK